MSVLDWSKSYCRFFEEISMIPHGSGNEEKLSNYIVEFAKKNNLKYLQDEMKNVIIYKAASEGAEDRPVLMLQAHLDMVCEKDANVEFDFVNEPLNLYVDDGYLKAKGTTLGADDGMGVAYILALLEDDTISHPALEAVFTVEEEIGLCGAKNLKAEYFKAKRMINLDGGGENTTCVSNSGGLRAEVNIKADYVTTNLPTYKLTVSGLDGGHSGGCIQKHKANANKIMGRVLKNIEKLQIVEICGGAKENAIARDGNVVFVSPLDECDLKKIVKKVNEELLSEYADSDSKILLQLEKQPQASLAIDQQTTNNIINFLYLTPNGLIAMSQLINDLPTISLNLGVVSTKDNNVRFCFAIRSPIESAKMDLVSQIDVFAKMCGGKTTHGAEYPGWVYEPDCKLRDLYREVCLECGYDKLNEFATHGGLETGIFKGLIPDLEIIATGANEIGAHTPMERLDLASFDRAFVLLKTLVKKCSEQ